MTTAPVVAAVLAVLCAVLLPQVPQRQVVGRALLVMALVVNVVLACVLP